MERLVPFEKLERDYYLDDDRDVGQRGGESDQELSSDDELDKELARLAGVRKCVAQKKKPKPVDEFEESMERELDGLILNYAEKFLPPKEQAPWQIQEQQTLKIEEVEEKDEDEDMELRVVASSSRITPAKKKTETETTQSTRQEIEKKEEQKMEVDGDDDMPALEMSDDEEDKPLAPSKDAEKKEELPKSALKPSTSDAATSSPSKKTPKKKVRIEEPVKSETETEEEEEENAIKREAKRLRREQKEKPPDFYDEDEDEDNERWAARRKQQKRGKETKKDEKPQQKSGRMEKDTDAVLSCPACMVTLTRDCQRHEVYKEQYRAMFVENCYVEPQQLVMAKTGKAKRNEVQKKKREAKAAIARGEEPPPPEPAPDTIAVGDVFHPVRCKVCNTQVAVYDTDEVFHFFNVLAGYA